MQQVVRLTVATGPHKGEKYCFRGATQCTMGRAPDCFVQLAGTDRDSHISRRHCRLALDLSALTVQDLGSRNGTYLDGQKIRKAELPLNEVDPWSDEINRCGNMLTIGGTTVRIDIVDCPSMQTPYVSQASLWDEGETAKKACPVPCI